MPHEVFNLSDTEPVVAVVARSDAGEWENIVPVRPGERELKGACGMFDCLILVERGVSEPDLVKTMLAGGLRDYFAHARERLADGEADRRLFRPGGDRALLADYGLATRSA